MAIASPVSKPRAAFDFMSDWGNTLLVGGCATYLVGRVLLPLLGKSAENYPYLSKMNAKFITFWTFDDFATVSSSVFVGFSDIMTLRDNRSNQEIQEGERDRSDADIVNDIRAGDPKWVHRPNVEMITGNYHDRCVWVARRSLATFLKIFSAYVLVHEGLKSVGALKTGPSLMIKACGATAGLAGLVIELYDIQSRKNDYNDHSLYGQLVKSPKPGDVIAIDRAGFDEAYTKDLTYSQVVKVIVMGVKVMALLSTLSKVEFGGLAGRVMKNSYLGKVLENSNDIFNGLFIGLTATLFIQKVHVGANKDKWTEDNGTWLPKYVLKKFSNSREFVRLTEAIAAALTDFGYDILEKTDLGALGKFAKSFDSFLDVPKVFEKTGGLIDKGTEIVNDIVVNGRVSARGIQEATLAVIKFLGNTFAALKFIGAFGGVAYLSDRVKGFGYIKNGLSSVGAIMTIPEGIFFPKKDWGAKDDKERYIASAIIAMSLGSLFLNGMGGLASAFGDKIIAPGVNKNFKPWVYNFVKINNSALATINDFIKAPAA